MVVRHRIKTFWEHRRVDLDQRVNEFLNTFKQGTHVVKDIKYQAETASTDEVSGYSALIWYTVEEQEI